MTKHTLPLLILAAALAGCGDKTVPGATAQPSQSAPAPQPSTATQPKVTEQSGVLRITTEPGGAQVFVNGQRKGNSPTEPGQSFAISLGEGTYIIDAKKADGEEYEYLGQQTDVFVTDNTMQSVAIKLERRPTELGKRVAQEHAQRQAAVRQQETERQGYVISADGQTVTDKNTGLVWMRCSLGQSWDGSSCAGSARQYNWEQAKHIARGFSHAGYSDWRLPTRDELKTLVYCSSGQREGFDRDGDGGGCRGSFRDPTIFEPAFPNTPKDSTFWSSSPDSSGRSGWAGSVYFWRGHVSGSPQDHDNPVRLVRHGQ